ncbi:cytochrome P450 [Lasiosphaeria hispida]|uniref:Cytochrome P450 n=1 Tax=Lasiosphaeria hispida TaxID=260671 RepID=A0AAJ0H5U1_9PEZI|nr:cytochrome P450 [Lasiosphaeria hispida]
MSNSSAWELLGWTTSLLVLWYATTAFAAWHRMRHIPGPVLARFSYMWHMYHVLTGRGGPTYTNLHNQYAGGGPFVCIAPNTVVTNDPEVLRRISAARTPYVRSAWYKGAQFHPKYGNMASMIDNDEHDRMKAKTASGYSGRENGSDFEPAIDSQIAALAALIRGKYLSTPGKLRPAELTSLMRYLTLDTITRLGYGKSFGHLDEGVDVTGYVGFLDASLKFLGLILEMPLLRKMVFSRSVLSWFAPRPTDKRGPGRVIGMIHGLVSERFQQDIKDRTWNDMVGGFIRNGLTQPEVEGEANLQILAGSETTSTALAATLIYLATTPHAYAGLKRQIRDAIDGGLVAADRPITFEQAQKLPYLQAVVWEGFRIRAPVNYGHYKSVPPVGDTIQGVFLPGGTTIGHNSLALTRNASVFGQDVEIFRPERFLEPECDAEKRAYRVRSLDIIFGGGRWTCSGKQVALFELNKVIFEFMRVFDIQPVDPRNAWQERHYGSPNLQVMRVRISEADWNVFR